MAVKDYNDNVFINCPFDEQFNDIFYAKIFTVFDCGFRARCALEENDGGEVRIEKISRIIGQCRYGIHDISRTDLCENTKLPRFNMPLELGMFFGAKKYGDQHQKKKCCLITDTERYRYQIFISDIAGQDIQAHNNDPIAAITVVRDWLRSASKRVTLPGGKLITKRYLTFREDLPKICREANIDEDELTFNDYATFVSEWLKNTDYDNHTSRSVQTGTCVLSPQRNFAGSATISEVDLERATLTYTPDTHMRGFFASPTEIRFSIDENFIDQYRKDTTVNFRVLEE